MKIVTACMLLLVVALSPQLVSARSLLQLGFGNQVNPQGTNPFGRLPPVPLLQIPVLRPPPLVTLPPAPPLRDEVNTISSAILGNPAVKSPPGPSALPLADVANTLTGIFSNPLNIQPSGSPASSSVSPSPNDLFDRLSGIFRNPLNSTGLNVTILSSPLDLTKLNTTIFDNRLNFTALNVSGIAGRLPQLPDNTSANDIADAISNLLRRPFNITVDAADLPNPFNSTSTLLTPNLGLLSDAIAATRAAISATNVSDSLASVASEVSDTLNKAISSAANALAPAVSAITGVPAADLSMTPPLVTGVHKGAITLTETVMFGGQEQGSSSIRATIQVPLLE